MNQGAYDYRQIEARWRQHWLERRTFRTPGPGEAGFAPDRPKAYVLDMFPYPSGAGLHIGHPRGYIASDIYTRYKRMRGYNVLHPMGWDSFGLPAEQYAIEHNVHPAVTTEQNIEHFRYQMQYLGLAYDWDRELATSREEYYTWTQWIFLQLYDAWYDRDHEWVDAVGQPRCGRGRPIATLTEEFAGGRRRYSPADERALGDAAARPWTDLTRAQQAAVLNNYRLVYQKEVVVNWCPMLGTVLANEEVTNEGKSERGDFPVYRRPLKQWMMRITAYGDRLLEDLDAADLPDGQGGRFGLDWPEPVKVMQRNWIGRSAGAEVEFDVLRPGTDDTAATLTVFTTRPDTLFGATFMVVALQHPLVTPGNPGCLVPEEWPAGTDPRWRGDRPEDPIREAMAAYAGRALDSVAGASAGKQQTGVFTGIMARNPVTGGAIPIFAADYVSMEYGTGAIMAVPAHDDRDYGFALAYGLPILPVVQPPEGWVGECFTGDGVSINSPGSAASRYAIDGLDTPAAKTRITAALGEQGRGRVMVNYKLRDWIFSRQRYWGEPFPLATRPDGSTETVDLPVALPEMEDFRPHTSDDPEAPIAPPLSRAGDAWLRVRVDGDECRRELSVMPQWAGSCWYYLRFIDPHNPRAFCDTRGERHFMPVDLYIGGAEHAVLHLLYSRFWHKALYDLGHVSTPEPFRKLFNQGMITADAYCDERGVYIDIREVEIRDGVAYRTGSDKPLQRQAGKMGKRYKNGLPPEEVGEEYGVDTLRLYEMYMGPLEASTPWSMEGIRGMQRFLQRVWRMLVSPERTAQLGGEASLEIQRLLHRTIRKVTEDIEGLRFNTAIAALIELNNELVKLPRVPVDVARPFILILSPFAPHLAEEIWSLAGFAGGEVSAQTWPTYDEALVREETVVLPIQVNGRMRGSIEVPVGVDEADLRRLVFELDAVRRHVPDPEKVRRFIVVPGKIVNIVA